MNAHVHIIEFIKQVEEKRLNAQSHCINPDGKIKSLVHKRLNRHVTTNECQFI